MLGESRGRGGMRWGYKGSSFFLCAGALARRFLFLPLAYGVGVAHNHFVHPGEWLGEEHRPLKEAQVATV